VGASLVTIIVLTGNVSDPVNAPKFFILGTFAVALLAMTFKQDRALDFRSLSSAYSAVLGFFVFWSLIAAIFSDSPLVQNVYGVYGRNTGLLTYTFLAIWAFAMSRLQKRDSIRQVVIGFLFAGLVNVIYCAWVIAFGDFIGWNNPYKAILGTFGNPNFISSFLGILLTVVVSISLKADKKLKLASAALIPIIIFELLKADSLQGIVIAVAGFWFVTSYWLLTTLKRRFVAYMYFVAGLTLGGLGVLGISGSGPLVRIMAQPTVALREQYWYAAWKMGINHPLLGVGMDSYGDWYRRMRGAGALIIPGPNVVTNVAHNVYLDIFAFGGFPLLLSYLALTLIGLIAIVLIIRKRQGYDPIFAAVAAIWATYQMQSLISINQIGLVVWGWVATGLLVGYSKLEFVETTVKAQTKNGKLNNANSFSTGIRGFIGLVIGALIAVPPLSADMKWMTALKAQNVESLEKSLTGDYLTPLNSLRLAQAAQTLERSGLNELAIKYARMGVEFNSNYDDAWETLYYMKLTTPEEKVKARKKLITLDPLNPEWKNLP
jgi:O-antigen ligase